MKLNSGFTTYTINNNVALDAVSSGVIFSTDHSLTSLSNLALFKTNLLYVWLVYLISLHIDVIGRAKMNKGYPVMTQYGMLYGQNKIHRKTHLFICPQLYNNCNLIFEEALKIDDFHI